MDWGLCLAIWRILIFDSAGPLLHANLSHIRTTGLQKKHDTTEINCRRAYSTLFLKHTCDTHGYALA